MSEQQRSKQNTIFVTILIVLLAIGFVAGSGIRGITWSRINSFFHIPTMVPGAPVGTVKVVSEESVVVDVVDKVSPAVVTVGITQTQQPQSLYEVNPFDPF